MKREDSDLIEAARAVCGKFPLRDEFSAGCVGAALRTADGNVYTGICIDVACGLGFCAEVAAVAEMLKHRETHIAAVAAIDHHGRLLAPCGRCRETMIQMDRRNSDCRVLLEAGREVKLGHLLPDRWLDEHEDADSGSPAD